MGNGFQTMIRSCARFGPAALIVTVLFTLTSSGIAVLADEPDPDTGQQSSDEEKDPGGGKEKKKSGSRYKDPEDGKFDLTAGSDRGEGFFPLVIPFNEPAVGFGLVLAVAYFHPQKSAPPASSTASQTAPPTATFGAGAGTTNGSWFAAVGHHHVFKHDTIRYLGAIGGGSVNLTFYGFGDGDTSNNDGVDFNTTLAGTVQQVKFRIAKLPVFAGFRYVFAATETTFDTREPGLVTGDADLAGAGALFEYDTRDTVFTPNKGLQATLDFSWFSEALGGDFNYGSVSTAFRYYLALGESWILGFRADLDGVGDDAPFYVLPFVTLRGVPAFRYLGNYVATFEIEPRYKIDERWSVLGFTGVGRAARELSNLRDADKVYSVGVGFRYLIARKLGLGTGIDVARGPEDTVVYLTVGSAW